LFQIFRLNFSWGMSKMHYFSNKFSKITKPLNLQHWWLEVLWFGQIVVFEADYDKIKLQNIVMTSFQWCHHHYITKKCHQNNVTKIFPILTPPNQYFWLHQWSWVNNLMVFKKAVLKKWSWSWKIRWSWSCNLVVLLHHWLVPYFAKKNAFKKYQIFTKSWNFLFFYKSS